MQITSLCANHSADMEGWARTSPILAVPPLPLAHDSINLQMSVSVLEFGQYL